MDFSSLPHRIVTAAPLPSMPLLNYNEDDEFDNGYRDTAANNANELMRSSRQQYENARELLKLIPPPPQQQRTTTNTKKTTSATRKRRSAVTASIVPQQQLPSSCQAPPNTALLSSVEMAKRKNGGSSGGRTKQTPVVAAIVGGASVPDAIVGNNDEVWQERRKQSRTFHAFVEMLNRHNLLRSDASHAESMRASLTIDEANLCSGRTLIRRNHHDQFHLLCQGTNVNPECVKRKIVRTVGGFLGESIDDLTDKTIIRFTYLWYGYATRETCSLESLTVSDMVDLLMTPNAVATVDRRLIVDERLGRMCQSCVEHFLRFNHIGKLCPKLYQQQPTSPQPPPSSSQQPSIASTAIMTNHHEEAAAAATVPQPAKIRKVTTKPTIGLGAACKKLVAPSPLTTAAATTAQPKQRKMVPSNIEQQQPPPTTSPPADDDLAYMSDYATSDDDDEDEYSDYDEVAASTNATVKN